MVANLSTLIESFGMRLADLIDKSFRSRAEFAREIGVNKAQITRWIAGNQLPHLDNLFAMVQTLNVDINYLLYGARTEHADIHKTIGLNDNSIDVLEKVKHDECQYLPTKGLTTSGVLDILLQDTSFINALADYLEAPDVSISANGRISNQPSDLVEGVTAWGANTSWVDIHKKAHLPTLLKLELDDAIRTARENVQEALKGQLVKKAKYDKRDTGCKRIQVDQEFRSSPIWGAKQKSKKEEN